MAYNYLEIKDPQNHNSDESKQYRRRILNK